MTSSSNPNDATAIDATATDATATDATSREDAAVPAIVAVEIESGPAVSAPVELPPGRHVIGRARTAAVRIEDPDVELHHLVLDVTADATMTVLHLAGRRTVLIDHEPISAWAMVRHGTTIDVGSSRLRLHRPTPAARPAHTGDIPGDPCRRILVRSPRAVPVLDVSAIEPPVAFQPARAAVGSHAGMLVGAVAGVVGGLVMAWITGSPLAAVFGLVAALASITTFAVARIRIARDARRGRRRAALDLERFTDAVAATAARIRTHHVGTVATPARRFSQVADDVLWSRRTEHGDAFTMSIGRGDIDRAVPVDAGASHVDHQLAAVLERHRVLHDVQVPVALDVNPRHVVAIEGAAAEAVARSMIAQLAVTTGPADWCLRVVTIDPDRWRWAGRLPHARAGGGHSSVIDADDGAAVTELVLGLDDGDSRRVVLVCDAPCLLATRTGPVRRLLDGQRDVTVVLVVTDGAALPAVCRSALHLGERGAGRWVADLHDAVAAASWDSVRVHAAGISSSTAEHVAGRLARYLDPEDPSTSAGRLPVAVRLTDLPGVPAGAAEVATAWATAGRDPALAAVIGTSIDGVIEIDLVRDGPHGLVAGTTGSGKSELLRTLVVALAAQVSPEHLSFVLVDYKGGATFDACAGLPHTVGVVTDLDHGLAERALLSLDAELHRRERLLRAHAAADLTAYRAIDDTAPLPRLVVVIDEFAALATEIPDFLSALVGIAQRGRSLGIHLVLATQRPAGVVDDAIRSNTNLRIALRLHDVADALDVVGDRSPAGFARGVPGRAMLRLGPDEVVEFQSASCTWSPTGVAVGTDLGVLAAAISAAADMTGAEEPHRPWLPPLDEVTFDDLEPGAVGVIDDPAGQCRRPLAWDARGNLALVGSLGSGTTTTLLAFAGTVLDGRAGVTLQVIDGRGDPALDVVVGVPACVGVVRLHEHERLGRLLRRLVDVIDERRAGSAAPRTRGPVDAVPVDVVLIDGLASLRRSLDEPGFSDEAAALDRILAEGPSVGVVTAAVMESDGASALSVLARFSERWIFHLDDASAGPMVGVPAARVPAALPGRMVVASSGLAAQVLVAASPFTPARSCDLEPVQRIEVLPSVVRAESLEDGERIDDDTDDNHDDNHDDTGIAVGRNFHDLSVAHLDVSPGDRLVIAGPPGSGRSNLLGHLVRSWRACHRDHHLVVLTGSERSPLAGSPWRRDVDDLADLMSRTTGDSASGAQHPRPHHLVVVDDAERLPDHLGHLAELAAARDGDGVTMLIAGRADALRSGFDHWSAPARRHRLGFVMSATSELDADVLGVAPPRRCPITPRPGLAWMTAHGSHTLVQTAFLDAAVPLTPD
jgi:DNA segregation ATPase FtsK/SpoIIIE, S-DNA-T family